MLVIETLKCKISDFLNASARDFKVCSKKMRFHAQLQFKILNGLLPPHTGLYGRKGKVVNGFFASREMCV